MDISSVNVRTDAMIFVVNDGKAMNHTRIVGKSVQHVEIVSILILRFVPLHTFHTLYILKLQFAYDLLFHFIQRQIQYNKHGEKEGESVISKQDDDNQQ